MARKPRDYSESGAADNAITEESGGLGGYLASEPDDGGDDEMFRKAANGGEDPIEAGGLPKAIADNEAKKPRKTLEEKRSDFSRLASSRVSRAIDALNALNHLSSIQSYDWTDEAIDKIFSTLKDKIDTVHTSFCEAKRPTDGRKKTSKQLSFRV